MAVTHEPGLRRSFSPGAGAWLLAVAGALVIVVVVAVVGADHSDSPSVSSSRGSGVSVTEAREVAPFSSVDLAGANTVAIHVGAPRSVAVIGDDNLVGRVTTRVRAGRLVIDDTGSYTTRAPMHVSVSVPSLEGVAITGSGTVTVEGLGSAETRVELAGEGTLVASGTTQRLTALLAGAGTLDLHDLAATDANVRLEGAGTIRVRATSTLDATLTGTGTILYGGDPTVTMHEAGTGMVVPE
jgi:hypothetical protein